WVSDMIAVSRGVCQMLRTDQVRFRLDSHRGCRRYHQDNITVRTVVTYYGQGTEYLLRENVDWEAYKDGMDNDRIVIDRSDIRFIETWDVAAIRGGPGGLMHKTPEVALDQPSVFLRVDPIDARLV
ncbi:MAG: DUF1826 domain-containing protein, partial [Pseudomonadota bacterium]